ncbi:Phosphatidylinositol phosphate synthase [Tessaracoccus sp. O5.2]|uniref:phosphatidylinositol phosphate synthase n=1 Tax=Tessaracoccus sp. O5.2 TaxID=3157622 RepID=UPI0035E64D37
MLSFLRGAYGRALTPLARFLLRIGLSPTAVTFAGTLGVVLAALWFLPRGEWIAGFAVVGVFLLADGLDGTMARAGGRQTRFGAFIDSTMDRIADGAVFAALAVWAAGRDVATLWCALAALVLGFVVSYARARAEAEGWDASVGIFERADRLVVAGVAAVAVDLGAPLWVLTLALGVVAAGSAVTVAQRVAAAWAASAASAPRRHPGTTRRRTRGSDSLSGPIAE